MTDQELKELFEREARLVREDAPIPAAGSVWWRSAMRARREAAASAMRPIVWFQAVGAVAVLAALVAAAGMLWPDGKGIWRGGFLDAMGPWAMPLLAMLGVCVIVVPVILYFALRESPPHIAQRLRRSIAPR